MQLNVGAGKSQGTGPWNSCLLTSERAYFSSTHRAHRPSPGSFMEVLLLFHLSPMVTHRESDMDWLIKRKEEFNKQVNQTAEHLQVPCQRPTAQQLWSKSPGSSQWLFHMSKQKMLIGTYKSSIWAGLCHKHFPALQYRLQEPQEVRKGYHTDTSLQNNSPFLLRLASFYN